MNKNITENTSNSKHYLSAGKEDAGSRLDKFLAQSLPDMSRTKVQELISSGHVLAGGKPITDSSHKVRDGEDYTITIPPPPPSDIIPKEIPLNVVFEDEYLMVIDKPPGLTVHPGAGTKNDTMVNALLAYGAGKLSGVGGMERPGIVHRIDRDTSGLLVVAKTDKAHRSLGKQIEKKALKRTYITVVWGIMSPAHGRIETLIGRNPSNRKKMAVLRTGGKVAITNYRTLEVFGNGIASLVECQLETGRTHQIRVHMANSGHSIVGDQTYGNPRKNLPSSIPAPVADMIRDFPRQALHSIRMSFTHPYSSKTIEVESEIPNDINNLIKSLKALPKN